MSLKLPEGATNLPSEEAKWLCSSLKQEEISGSPREETRADEPSRRVMLSFGQQRLWYLEQLHPASALYNEHFTLHLKGKLHLEALHRSLQTIIRRHDILRTTFEDRAGRPEQVIHKELDLPVTVIDWRLLAVSEKQQRMDELILQDTQTPFDLSKLPLLRTHVVQLEDEQWLLLFTYHHIIFDGWSLRVLFEELSHCYQAYIQGKEPALAPLPIQYADYSIWQYEQERQGAYSSQRDYWQKQLEGAPTILELPTDHPRSALSNFAGATLPVSLDTQQTEHLRMLARSEGCSLYMAILAVWLTLLYRYSSQEDLLIGTLIANRTKRETEQLIGFFANTLVLRFGVGDDPRFRDLLKRVREVTLNAYEHQDLPFEQVVSMTQPLRAVNHMPLVQVVFTFQNARQLRVSLPGLEAEYQRRWTQTAKFDLVLDLVEDNQGVHGALEYNVELFAHERMQQMLRHLQTLLRSAITLPQRRLSELPLLTEEEKHLLITKYIPTLPILSSEKNLIQLFEDQARQIPDAIALVFEQEQLSYSQLNLRANRLAHYLQALGVGPEVRVGLCLERNLDLIVGLLAILKAGGAYVPLDPTYPTQRLAFLLEDAQVALVLTQQRLLSSMPPDAEQVLCLDAPGLQEILAKQSPENPVSAVDGQNLAYLIYTSGSTGTPKGAMITHANASRLFAVTQSQFHFTAQDVWTLFHSIAFDFSVWELWGALLNGGRLVLVSYLTSRSPQDFWQLLIQEQVTVLNQTPSAFRQLCATELAEGAAKAGALRLIIFGGEALDIASVQIWFARFGDSSPRLINMYGITETTVHVTSHVLRTSELAMSRQSIIGNPLADLQLYVLDAHLQPTPPGLPGELYVGGAGLARGYMGRPALTAERFVPHPWSQQPGSRLYKTGDLARWRWDGQLEYLGRNDAQVKIRGFRIELGEIETVLASHPGVKEAVVLLQNEGTRDGQLVAYVVPRGEPGPTVSELRGYLQTRLPDYMLPVAFLLLNALPLSPNGKLNWRELSVHHSARPELEEAYVAPRTPEEEILVGIWSQVLHLEQVGVHDNFFDLGGDSIRSVQALALARKRGLSCSLMQLFQQKTIARLATVLDQESRDGIAVATSQPFSLLTSEERQCMPTGVENAYPLTLLQAGMFFHSASSPQSTLYHNVTSYHLEACLDLGCLQAALQQVVARHPVLRTSFELSTYNQPLQLVHQLVEIPVPYEDLRHLTVLEQEAVIARVIEKEKERKFVWTQAPLLRVQVHQRSEQSFQITMTEHHAILDGWSVASLLTELFKRYMALLQTGEAPAPEPLAVTFQDFVALEQEVLASDEAKAYWTRQLAGSSRTILPRWATARKVDDPSQLFVVEIPVSSEVTRGLQKLARTAAVPLKSVLLAAHLNVMRVLGAEDDVLTGMVANGRPETTDGERVLGLFLNTVPHRQRLEGGSWIDLVQETFETERSSLPWRRYPLAQIQREQGGQPLFETAFNFTHFHVYQSLEDVSQLRVLDTESFIQTNFTLMVHFSQALASSQLQLRLECNANQLPAEQIEAIGGYYSRTLAAMANFPTARYELQSLLSSEEEQQTLYAWNATRTDALLHGCLHQLVEAQAERTPQAVAVVFERAQLAYGELNRRANSLAHYLQALGVGPEVRVGLCLERNLDLIVGLLAILKAGGAYVPLDPTYPTQRLAFLLEDAQVALVLTQQRLLSSMPPVAEQVLCLDAPDLQEILAEQSSENPVSSVDGQNLAYLIYTSGSTGTPKGVAIEHHNTVAFINWARDIFSGEDLAGVLASTSICFDLSVFEIFVPLSQGGKVILVENILHLPALPVSRDVTLINTVPSVMTQLLQADWVPGSRCIINFAGEALPHTLVQQLYQHQEVHKIFNLYGPSEDTTYSTWALLQKDSQQLPPIGRPITNTQTYVLNRWLLPVPIGAPGELYIGGNGLARCYLQRPELTAESFVPNPFGNTPGSRLYKTGDQVRYRVDGTLEYLGRLDQQIKLCGFRIEPGEVEAVLGEHPQAGQCVVLSREYASGDQRLVAYVVLKRPSTSAPSVLELRRFLQTKLPDYLVPSAFLWLEALPHTPNGKIDQRALLSLQVQHDVSGMYTAPRSEAELAIATIWAEVLGLERVGLEDNFFDLGGHSLQVIRVCDRLAKVLGRTVPVTSMFQYSTVGTLAAALDGQNKSTSLQRSAKGVRSRKLARLRVRGGKHRE